MLALSVKSPLVTPSLCSTAWLTLRDGTGNVHTPPPVHTCRLSRGQGASEECGLWSQSLPRGRVLPQTTRSRGPRFLLRVGMRVVPETVGRELSWSRLPSFPVAGSLHLGASV